MWPRTSCMSAHIRSMPQPEMARGWPLCSLIEKSRVAVDKHHRHSGRDRLKGPGGPLAGHMLSVCAATLQGGGRGNPAVLWRGIAHNAAALPGLSRHRPRHCPRHLLRALPGTLQPSNDVWLWVHVVIRSIMQPSGQRTRCVPVNYACNKLTQPLACLKHMDTCRRVSWKGGQDF